MVEVLVWDALKEMEKNLQQYFSQNEQTFEEMLHEKIAREHEYRNSSAFQKRHGRKKNAKLTPKELDELQRDLGKGRSLTLGIKLFGIRTDFYAFQESYAPNISTLGGPFGTPTVMAEGLHKHLETQIKQSLEARVTPLLYTVREPFTWSEEEKKHLRKIRNYSKLTKAAQKSFDQEMESYVERCLTDDERQEFVRRYVRFLN